jgi:hypothetical protein
LPIGSSVHHSALARRHQWRSGLVAVTLVTLGGCSSRLDLDPTETGSIPAAPAGAESAAVSPVPVIAKPERTDDWEAVRQKIVATPPAMAKAKPKPGDKPAPAAALAWENGDSGNSGTITDLIASTSAAGRSCRNFATTLASVDGVRAYRGELCRNGAAWEYTRLEPVDRMAENRPKS